MAIIMAGMAAWQATGDATPPTLQLPLLTFRQRSRKRFLHA
ncbi:MAG: hypothetical protein OJF51_002752 [Nitrospira sp.]|nr:MAG: hypothetical protein OJF51_002752 [Nitrospira sp.]